MNKPSHLNSAAAGTAAAAILVGGKGTRLSSVISDVPKPLAPIGDKPFLFHVLNLLARAGIQKVILLTGYMHEKIVAACGNGDEFGLQIAYSHETQPLGTGGALSNAKHLLSEYDDFILLNGDTYFDSSIINLIQHPLSADDIALIGVTHTTDTNRYGSIQIEPESLRITAFLEKSNTQASYVNAGIYKLSTKILAHIPEQQFLSIEQNIFPDLIHNNHQLKAIMLDGGFHDIGLPESYFAFNKEWLHRSDNSKR